MAALNLVAAERAMPLAKLLSERFLETIHVNGLIIDTDSVTEATRALHRDGYRAVKLKVGNDPVEVDIAKFEKVHGNIKKVEGSGSPLIPMNFGGPTAQA